MRDPQTPRDTALAESGSLPPVCGASSGSLGLNEGIPSPDGRWSIRVGTVRTFSEDLKNVWLEVSDTKSRSSKRTVVPGHSLGEECGLFWDHSGYFYLLNLTGPENARSYRLVQFDPNQETFKSIGISNGRAFMSPDGDWIIWETGKLSEMAGRGTAIKAGTIIVYDITQNNNFIVMAFSALGFFNQWK